MSWSKAISSVCLAGALVLSPAIAGAQGHGHGKGHDKAKPHKVEKEAHADTADHSATAVHHDVVIDREGHVRAIHEYVTSGSLPPGLAKREALPPGLRAQLHERGTLPPGLQKRLVPVPAPLVGRLPRVPSYYHRYFAGNDLVIVDGRSQRIVAIVPDAWR